MVFTVMGLSWMVSDSNGFLYCPRGLIGTSGGSSMSYCSLVAYRDFVVQGMDV